MGDGSRDPGRRSPGVTRAGSLPRLHIVTNDEIVARPDFLATAAELLTLGRERLALHLRVPAAGGRRMFDLAERLVAIAGGSGATLIVNDRLDVALAVSARGAQVGRRGLPLQDARKLLGAERLLGASVHDVEEGRCAAAAGSDFLLAGTLYPSSSHPERAPTGPEWLTALNASGEAPVIGIGGIDLERVREVLAAGAAGVAVIRAVWDAEQPGDRLLRFIDALY